MVAVLAAGAPAGLVLLATTVIAVRTRCGGCRARARWAWVGRLVPVEGE